MHRSPSRAREGSYPPYSPLLPSVLTHSLPLPLSPLLSPLPCTALGYVTPLLFGYDPTLPPEVSDGFILPFSDGNGGGGGGGGASGGAEGDAASSSAAAAPSPLPVLFRILDTPLERPSVPVALSYHAMLAARCLARLSGMNNAPLLPHAPSMHMSPYAATAPCSLPH